MARTLNATASSSAEADVENDVRSYPYPGNIIENNTIEFINVYVKPGKPPKFDADVKERMR